jgi:hypothetical protein
MLDWNRRELLKVGTSRCDAPARAVAGGTNCLRRALLPHVAPPIAVRKDRGADSAARRPYQAN